MENQPPQNPTPNQPQSPANPIQPAQVPTARDPQTTITGGKKKFSVKLIIGIVVFLLLAGGAAAGYIYRDSLMSMVSKPTPTPTPAPIVTITPTPDPTTDWQTYEGNGFSVKYPPDARIEENKELQSIVIYPVKRDEYRNSPEYGTKLYKLIYHVNISTIDNPQNLNVLEYIEQGLKAMEEQTEPGPTEARLARQSIKEREINGLSTTSIIQGHSGKVEYLYIAKESKIYKISITGDEYEPFPEVIKTTDQILSTFKFTD